MSPVLPVLPALAGSPAVFPAFAQAAWLGVDPEFNPLQIQLLPGERSPVLPPVHSGPQEHIAQLEQRGALKDMPPVQTFQSVLDHTCQHQAILMIVLRQAARQWQRDRAVRRELLGQFGR